MPVGSTASQRATVSPRSSSSRSAANSRFAAGKDVNFVTVIYGSDVTEEEAEAACDAIRAKLGDKVDVSAIPGGQPVYYYFLSVE